VQGVRASEQRGGGKCGGTDGHPRWGGRVRVRGAARRGAARVPGARARRIPLVCQAAGLACAARALSALGLTILAFLVRLVCRAMESGSAALSRSWSQAPDSNAWLAGSACEGARAAVWAYVLVCGWSCVSPWVDGWVGEWEGGGRVFALCV
jgi:hypothetical protein